MKNFDSIGLIHFNSIYAVSTILSRKKKKKHCILELRILMTESPHRRFYS